MAGSAHGLGPHCVGRRVVVRRLLRGRTGPSGGPAMTDLLGVMETWDGEHTTVRDSAGSLTEIPVADIVSGKPVPPRPSPRLRVSAEEAERRAAGTWPAPDTAPLGQWLLRAAGGYSSRANSVLAVGDPGLAVDEALGGVVDFYRGRGLDPCAQVVVASPQHRAFEAAGWQPARPGEADTVFEIASLAQASRRARDLLPASVPAVEVGTTATAAWLADDARACVHRQAATTVLEGPAEVAFAAVGDPVVAKGRVALTEGPDAWAGLSNVWVHPDARRRRLALAVVARLLAWAAERGATTAFLQVRGDNPAALALYEQLGFAAHHEYRYLAPPS